MRWLVLLLAMEQQTRPNARGMYFEEAVPVVEAEYGEPFWDVVKGFADLGESMPSTAEILGMSRHSLIYRVRKKGVTHWFPKRGNSNRYKLLRSEWAKERAHKQFAAHVDRQKKRVMYRGELVEVSATARSLGISFHTALDRFNKGFPPEDIFYKGTLPPRRSGNRGHPWRKQYEQQER